MGKLIDMDVLMVALTQAGVLPGLIEVVEKAAGELPAAEAAPPSGYYSQDYVSQAMREATDAARQEAAAFAASSAVKMSNDIMDYIDGTQEHLVSPMGVNLTRAAILRDIVQGAEKPAPLNAEQVEAATHINPTLIGEYEEALKDVPAAGAVIEPPTAGAFLRKAAAIVDGNREATHGDRERSFDAIAREWQAYLELRKGGPLVGRDVALMMVKLKMVRAILGDATFEDHYVDMAGYAALAGEV